VRIDLSPSALSARELARDDLPRLQALFEANPEYFLAVNGVAPRPDEAMREFDDRPPAHMPFDRCLVIGVEDGAGRCVAVASLLSDFLAESVWHIGLFLVDASLHGTGQAATLYRGLERWMRDEGAEWIRLGAVAGNGRAERFWEKMGYVETRRREGVKMLERVNAVRVFAKPLAGGDIATYLRLVPRDVPGAA
jgi:GNAT superfamily N-acetyltransferase